MNDCPKVRLGDLFVFKNGRAFKKEEWTTTGLPIIRIQNLNSANASFNYYSGDYDKDILVQLGDLLFSWSGTVGSSFGSHLWAGERGVLNQHIFKVGLTDAISKQYAYYGLRHITVDIENAVNGAVGLVHITKEKLNEFTLPLPRPSEQQRIVAILDQAFAGIATAEANAERNLENARGIFESQLEAVFSQRGDGWVETTLETVLAIQPQNGWSPPAENHSRSGTPVLTLSAVTGFRFRPDKIKFTSAPTDARRHYWVKNGDFLITRSNTPELVGHVAIANGINEATIYPDLITRMNPMPDRMLTEFLYYQLRTASLRKEITGRAQGANPTMKKISNGAVKTLPIAAPPVAKQKAIVETLNAAEQETQRLADIYERKLIALDVLKKSLLHQAFSGELMARKTT
jgi:type I restriction enzyme S subunit